MDIPKVHKPEIVIDARADETAWASAMQVEDFITYRPKPGIPAENRTRVRVISSEQALYVHFEARTSYPEQLRAGYGRRDSRRNDDFVGILLDAQGESERAALFIINPLGVQMDGTLVRGRDSELVPWRGGWSSWDTRWNSAGRKTDEGYEVEVEIPWTSIRHPTSVDNARILFCRRSARDNEMSTWPVIDPSKQGVLIQTRNVGGPGPVPNSSPWLFQPELTATQTDSGVPKDRLGAAGLAPGLTVQYSPSASLQMLATANPDFSQVESDQTKIDVNERYSLRYEEKRPFFLEGQEWFQHPIKDLIYTRTMVTPLYGFRATSETGQITTSALHVWDRQPAPSVSEGDSWTAEEVDERDAIATIGRLRWAIGEDSMVGAIVSDRRILNSNLQHQMFGIDGRVGLSDAVNLEAAALGSMTTGSNQQGHFAPAGLIRNRFNFDRVESMTELTYLSKDFRSENGFQPRADWVGVEHETEFFVFPSWNAIPRIFIMPATGEAAWTEAGAMRAYSYEPGFGFWTSGGALFWFESAFNGEEFADQWFDTVQGKIMAGGSWNRWLRTWIRASAGEGVLYDADAPSTGFINKVNTDITLQPFHSVHFSPQIGWERFTQGGDVVYDGHVLRLKLDLYATPRLWNRLIYDHSAFDDSDSYETLFAWEHSPGSAIYLGGTTSVIRGTEQSPSPNEGKRTWSIFAKASWVFSG